MIIKIIFLIQLFFVLPGYIVNAQIDSCRSECNGDKWLPDKKSSPNYATLTLNNIEFKVAYRTRIACKVNYDYYIESVAASNSGDLINLINEAGSFATLITRISMDLIALNPAKYPPYKEGECETALRVFKAAFWKIDSTKKIEIAIPCAQNMCFEQYATICIKNGGKRLEFKSVNNVDSRIGNTNIVTSENIFECTPVN